MDVARVNILSTLGTSNVNNVIGVMSATGWTPTELAQLAQDVCSEWISNMVPVISNAVTILGYSYVDLTDPTIGGAGTLPAIGGLAQPSVPTFACAKINWKTGLRGRAYQGRTGLAGVPENQTDASLPNQLTGTYRTNVQNAATQFAIDANTTMQVTVADAFLAVVSTVSHGIARPTPLATKILSILVSNELGTRRSRLH